MKNTALLLWSLFVWANWYSETDNTNIQTINEIQNIIPCTDDSARHLINIKQTHIRDRDETILYGIHILKKISESQKDVYKILKTLNSPVVFVEWLDSEPSSIEEIEDLRLSRIKHAVKWSTDMALDSIINLLENNEIFNEIQEYRIKSMTISRLYNIYHWEKENDSVKHYLKDELKYPLNDDERYTIKGMNENKSFFEQLEWFKKDLSEEKSKIEEKIETRKKKLEKQKDTEKKELLMKYTYLAGWALKLASEKSIKLLDGED